MSPGKCYLADWTCQRFLFLEKYVGQGYPSSHACLEMKHASLWDLLLSFLSKRRGEWESERERERRERKETGQMYVAEGTKGRNGRKGRKRESKRQEKEERNSFSPTCAYMFVCFSTISASFVSVSNPLWYYYCFANARNSRTTWVSSFSIPSPAGQLELLGCRQYATELLGWVEYATLTHPLHLKGKRKSQGNVLSVVQFRKWTCFVVTLFIVSFKTRTPAVCSIYLP